MIRRVDLQLAAAAVIAAAVLFAGGASRIAAAENESLIDITAAVVVAPTDAAGPERKAVEMLVEEVEKRTNVRLPRADSIPAAATKPIIVVGRAAQVTAFARVGNSESTTAFAAEGYQLRVENGRGASPIVTVTGNDARGVLFGVGRLLRSMQMTRGRIALPADLNVTTAPKYALRGHQLGYRAIPNSYDGWTVEVWEQYIRDLVVWGTNAVELLPPRTDDVSVSPHFPLPPMRMMVEMSRICQEYGLEVWVWFPALDEDYSKLSTIEFALKEWGEVFKRLPRLDHVLVPGGDPGETPARLLMPLLEKQAANLRRYHPRAGMWLAPQGFDGPSMDDFFHALNEEPAWLTGLAYGPQTRISLPHLRRLTPKKYPIRHYPDITHTHHCQYPVPDWDTAYAMTQGREPINPRPAAQAHIFRIQQPYAERGFITYSEGCNDDVNKIVWSALGWDPAADVAAVLREYGRYFIGPGYADEFAQGLFALERNWRGPLLANAGVTTTLNQFRAMERRADQALLANWRFQQTLYRAYYDAYTRGRLIYETDLEERALSHLRGADKTGALVAIERAESELDQLIKEGAAADLRRRVFELAEALFRSIKMQLSVERYKAHSIGRGANLDTVDFPLNSRPWLKKRFSAIRQLAAEVDRLKAIEEITNWTNPGPGGFYDDLGDPSRQPHLVRGVGFDRDPQFFESSLAIFERGAQPAGPRSWWNNAIAFYDAPLQMRYADLDPHARYKVRAVYAGEPKAATRIKLLADEKLEVHPFIDKRYEVVEYDLPYEATRDGELTLSWYREPAGGRAGRGNQVAEVWLIKK